MIGLTLGVLAILLLIWAVVDRHLAAIRGQTAAINQGLLDIESKLEETNGLLNCLIRDIRWMSRADQDARDAAREADMNAGPI